ncbi:MAG: hypothetical protein EOP10_07195 [Proteobacteria bacterium]|nr:MAG: hypothetical protein EOP10_07195 [Pseudomonadota bacterium]
MHLDSTTWAVLAALLLTAIAALVWVFTRPLPKFPERETPELPLPLEPIHLRFDSSGALHHHSRIFSEQSDEWKTSLRRSGETLRKNNVSEIILLHGTFVGSDPVNIFSSLRSVFPKISQRIESGLTQRMRGLIDTVAQDNGNFIPAYAELLQKALGDKISTGLFYWSSSNHHLGRMEGAVGLLQRLAKQGPRASHERILYIGHSHARQVFALFTHFINAAGDKKATGAELWEFVEREGLASEGLQDKIVAIKKKKPKFDFVTLGGPIRYKWCFIPDMKVLHIVNHHGETSKVPSIWTFWKTTSGDYVQQWGMIGSDNIAPTPRERNLNRALDEILGKGWHTRLWLQSIVRRERLGDFGRTLLIDYFHAARQRTNFIKTVFGHGVYTRFDVMQFQFELISQYMYDEKR